MELRLRRSPAHHTARSPRSQRRGGTEPMQPGSGTSYNEEQVMRRPLMSHPWILRCIGLVLALSHVVPASGFGPGEAAGGPRAGQTTKPRPSRADFAVLVWYRRDKPLETFQYQIY